MNIRTYSFISKKINFILDKFSRRWINIPMIPIAYLKNLLFEKKIIKVIQPIFDKYVDSDWETLNLQKKTSDYTIWICWLQGIDNAPPLVKSCVERIKTFYADKHRITIVSLLNYEEYTNISDIIKLKYEKGLVSHAHFSDIIRVNLLAKNGGVWIDATVYLYKKLPDPFFTLNFYSLRASILPNYYSVSKAKWTSYLFSCDRGNLFMEFLNESYDLYWAKNDVIIDYFLLDYLFIIAYKKFILLNRFIESFEVLGNNTFLLASCFNKTFDIGKTEVSKDKVGIYKLSYKDKYEEQNDKGQMTTYGAFTKRLI